jgi:hypothetical protein
MMKRIVCPRLRSAFWQVARWLPANCGFPLRRGVRVGSIFPMVAGLRESLSHKVAGMQVTAEVTGGSVDNVKLVGAGEAISDFRPLILRWTGGRGLGPMPIRGRRTSLLLRCSTTASCTWSPAPTCKVTDVAQLKGRRISVGSAGSSTRGDRRSHPGCGTALAVEGCEAGEPERG